MKQHLKRVWQSLKIKDKIKFFTRIVFASIFLSIFLAVWAVKYSLFDFSLILNSNSLASDFVHCIETETDLFEDYVKTGNETIYAELEEAITDTKLAVAQLPYDYKKIGEARYAQTWSILNMYQVYCDKRDHVLSRGEKTSEYISDLYEVYDIQNYLQDYAKQLMRDTLEDGVSIYAKEVKMIIIVPVLLILFELFFIFCTQSISALMNKSIVSPIGELAEASRKIAENDFFIDDIKTQSKDELGELVTAFNKMKYATGEYITALEERRKAFDLYHEKELEKIEIDCQTDAKLVLIPTFTFQPIVENGIIHGLGPKEKGGHILIRIREIRNKICMVVADNGTGMCPETLNRLRQELREEESNRVSRARIGLFNIYKRIRTMYKDGQMQIYSKMGVGTIIRIYIADERGTYFGE